MRRVDIFGLTKHIYAGNTDNMFTYQYTRYNRDVYTGKCTRSELVNDEMVETPISKQEFNEALQKCKEVFQNQFEVSVPQTYINADGKIVFHAVIDNEVVELTDINEMLKMQGIDYVIIDGKQYRTTLEVFDVLSEKYAEMQKQEEKNVGSKINRDELQEISEHAVRKIMRMEIPSIYLRCLAFKDLFLQICREYNLEHIRDLRNHYLCDVHEFIDDYELPLYLWEQVELEKESKV